MKLKIYILLILVLLAVSGLAQFDSTYVSLTKNKFSVSSLSELHSTRLNLDLNKQYREIYEDVNINYKAQNGLYVGFGLSFYRLGLAISFKLPYTSIPELKYSTAFSFAGGYSYRKFYGEFKTKHYEGLQREIVRYTDDDVSSEVEINHDVETRQYGLTLYFFQSNKYNFDANFKNYNTQLKSAFTFVYAGGLNYYNFNGQLDLSERKLGGIEKNIEVRTLKFMPGAAVSIVRNNFYFSSIALAGLAYDYNILDFDAIRHGFSSVLELRAIFGYNNKYFFASLNAKYGYDFVLLRDNNLSIHNLMFNFKVGIKLNSKYLGKIGKYL